MKRLIGVMVLCLAGPALADTGFPPTGVYGTDAGCEAYMGGTEGNYFGFDGNGQGWGGYGEMNCDIKSKKRVGKEWHIKSACTFIGAEDTPTNQDNVLKITKLDKEIVWDGETYKRCGEPPWEPAEDANQ